jgi:hypothetical protein
MHKYGRQTQKHPKESRKFCYINSMCLRIPNMNSVIARPEESDAVPENLALHHSNSHCVFHISIVRRNGQSMTCSNSANNSTSNSGGINDAG